jgi:hypothetical protein
MSTKATATSSSGGIGIAGILTIIFVVCKIFAVGPIAVWSWWWVFSPLWIMALVVAGILLIALLIVAIAAWAESR